ncbi:MAG: hypothetical protein ACP5N2_00740 [Candidatus Nanoarchaeia archaeon]
MKIKRKVSTARIFVALVIAILIFFLGIALGFIIDSERIQWVQFQSQQQKADYESIQWQYLFLTSTTDKEETCIALHVALEKSVKDLGKSLDTIQSYKKESQINKKDYEIIERTYLIDNLKYWLLASKTKKECNEDYILVLYFFSENECPTCPDQGVILTHYKNLYDDKLLVFPINLDLEDQEASLGILRGVYNITSLPSIIVGNTKYSEVVSKDQLGEIICDNFRDKSSCKY